MGIDGKYGQVTTERGNIGDDEPVVVFRAQDQLLPAVLDNYHQLCANAGSHSRHLDLIRTTRRQVEQWQANNPTKIPTSDSLATE